MIFVLVPGLPLSLKKLYKNHHSIPNCASQVTLLFFHMENKSLSDVTFFTFLPFELLSLVRYYLVGLRRKLFD